MSDRRLSRKLAALCMLIAAVIVVGLGHAQRSASHAAD
jgi:hypothetical protein